MITFALILALAVLLAAVLVQLSQKPQPPRAPAQDPTNLKVTDVRPGDVISIAGAGDDLNDLDFTVDRMVRCEAGAGCWSEVAGSYRERRVALRVSGEDDVETALAGGAAKATLEDLGLAEEDLAQMDERQNTADSFEFDGKVWQYRRSREVKAWRDGAGVPSTYYSWEFGEREGKRLLAVRKAAGEPFAVTLYTGIPAGDVTVYRGGHA